MKRVVLILYFTTLMHNQLRAVVKEKKPFLVNQVMKAILRATPKRISTSSAIDVQVV